MQSDVVIILLILVAQIHGKEIATHHMKYAKGATTYTENLVDKLVDKVFNSPEHFWHQHLSALETLTQVPGADAVVKAQPSSSRRGRRLLSKPASHSVLNLAERPGSLVAKTDFSPVEVPKNKASSKGDVEAGTSSPEAPEATASTDKQVKTTQALKDKVNSMTDSSGDKSWGVEAKDIVRLAVPMFFTGISWVTMAATDTALLGHVNSESLSSSAYSELWTRTIGVLLYQNVLRTFCSNAFGAKKFELVGIWAQVSLACLAPIMLVVALGQCLTAPILESFHAPVDIIPKAAYYSVVLAAALPARLGLQHLLPFFTSQRIMKPGTISAFSAMLANLVFGLIFVLGIPVPGWGGFGFAACPIVTACASWLQLLLMWGIYCAGQNLHKKCWPGWSCSHITADRVKQYLRMYVPAALSAASDFWRVSVIGVVAASMGKEQLAVFNSSFRLLWIFSTFIIGMASSVGIKVGQALGRNQPWTARRTTLTGTTMVASMLAVMGVVFYLIPRQLARIFSSDDRILDQFVESRLPLALMMVGMNLAIFLEAIPRALGRTRLMLYMSLVGSWLGQVPSVFLCTRLWRNDLVGIYTGASSGYALLCALYLFIIGRINWTNEAVLAMKRSEALGKSK